MSEESQITPDSLIIVAGFVFCIIARRDGDRYDAVSYFAETQQPKFVFRDIDTMFLIRYASDRIAIWAQ